MCLESNSRLLSPTTPVGDLDRVCGFWCPPGPVLVIVAISGVRQQVEDLPLLLFQRNLSNKDILDFIVT